VLAALAALVGLDPAVAVLVTALDVGVDVTVAGVESVVLVVAVAAALWVTPAMAAMVTPTPATATPLAANVARRMRRWAGCFGFIPKTLRPPASGRPHPNVKRTSNPYVRQP
jgi:urea transporter